MFKQGHKLKGLKIISDINNNVPVKLGAPSPIIPELSQTPTDETPLHRARSGSFRDSLGLGDLVPSASFRSTPTPSRIKAKAAKGRKGGSPLQSDPMLDFDPLASSFGTFSIDAAAAALGGDLELAEDSATRAAEIDEPSIGLPLHSSPPPVVTTEELATAEAVEHAVKSKDLTQIAALLDLPFVEKYLFFKAYDVPGIFFLVSKHFSKSAIATFKVGESRGLHDLTLLKFSELLEMRSFFPTSIMKAIPVGKFPGQFKDKKLPDGVPERPVTDGTDSTHIHGVTLDKREEYTFNQADALRKQSLLVGSFQTFIDDQDSQPIPPIHSARIVILAYILFMKDLKSNDGGVLNCLDGTPKLVDAVENALMYSSVLLPPDSAKHIISINLPIVDKVKDQVINPDEIKLLFEQFAKCSEGFAEGLMKIILTDRAYATQLQKVISLPKDHQRIDFHPGHTFIEDPRQLAGYLDARLKRVVIGLDHLHKQGKNISILDLLQELDPDYVSAYKIVDKAIKGEVVDGRVSRSAVNAFRTSTPGEIVGSAFFPYHPEYFPSENLANYADDLFYNIKDLLKNITKGREDRPSGEGAGKRQVKLLRKIHQANEHFDIVRFNFPTHPDLAFPHKDRLSRAETAQDNLRKIDRKLRELFDSAYDDSPEISEFNSNIEYLQKQIDSRKALVGALPYSSSSPPMVAAVDQSISKYDKGSPEMTAIMDLNPSEKLYGDITSDQGSTQEISDPPPLYKSSTELRPTLDLKLLEARALDSRPFSTRPRPTLDSISLVARRGAFIAISSLRRVGQTELSPVTQPAGDSVEKPVKSEDDVTHKPKPVKF